MPEEMRGRHLSGYVGLDETFAGNYDRLARNVLYSQGVAKDTPEYQLRIARININNPGYSPGRGNGGLVFPTAAVVPDHLPPLKVGDIVEVRQTGTWRTVEDFAKKGEGNIVVRVLCRKASVDYEACLDRQPRIGKFKGVGPTNTPYPASVADYGFTFSAAYREDGRPRND